MCVSVWVFLRTYSLQNVFCIFVFAFLSFNIYEVIFSIFISTFFWVCHECLLCVLPTCCYLCIVAGASVASLVCQVMCTSCLVCAWLQQLVQGQVAPSSVPGAVAGPFPQLAAAGVAAAAAQPGAVATSPGLDEFAAAQMQMQATAAVQVWTCWAAVLEWRADNNPSTIGRHQITLSTLSL